MNDQGRRTAHDPFIVQTHRGRRNGVQNPADIAIAPWNRFLGPAALRDGLARADVSDRRGHHARRPATLLLWAAE